jgi:integrase
MARKLLPSLKRRARGTGTVFWNEARAVWVARSACGRIQRSDPVQARAIAKLARAEPPTASITLAEWCGRWLAAGDVRPATRRIRDNAIRNFIVPTLGRFRLADLTTHHIQLATKQWSVDRQPGTVGLNLSVLSGCLQAAVRAAILERNPAQHIRRPRSSARKINPLTPDEINRVVQAALHWPQARILALLATVGCRVGEAMALEVTDVVAGRLTIARSIDRKTRQMGPTKSANGQRTIRLPLVVAPIVQAAIGTRRRGPLFLTTIGTRITHGTASRHWIRLQDDLGLPRRNLHQLRHSCASNLIAAGVPVADVARYLGDDVRTVIATYVHATGSDPSDTIDRLVR